MEGIRNDNGRNWGFAGYSVIKAKDVFSTPGTSSHFAGGTENPITVARFFNAATGGFRFYSGEWMKRNRVKPELITSELNKFL